MDVTNLFDLAANTPGWQGETIVDLGDVKSRLFKLTPDKAMVLFEEGHPVNEWLLVLQGEILVEAEDVGSVTLKAGDSMMVPPHVNHRLNVSAPAIGLITRDMTLAPASEVAEMFVEKAS